MTEGTAFLHERLEGLSGAQVQDAHTETDIQTVLILTLYALISPQD